MTISIVAGRSTDVFHVLLSEKISCVLGMPRSLRGVGIKDDMTYLQKSGNKYHSQTTQIDGITYHSKLEAAYAQELAIRVLAKDIKSWERQVKLDLRVNGMHITNYYIDFVVLHNDGSREYVEVKGMEMELWKLKWRILEATFDTDFKEHADDRLTVIKQSSWGSPKLKKGGMYNNARIIQY